VPLRTARQVRSFSACGAWAAAVRTCVFRPLRPFPSRPWGLRPQIPAFGLNGLVLKRRTGWRTPAGGWGMRTAHASSSNGGRTGWPPSGWVGD